MGKMKNKGFTLIELLVVIAIIGILSGIVLTSLNTARGKAKDAAVKADMSGIRAAAEIYYDDKGSYEGMFTNNTCASSNSDLSTYLTKITADASGEVCQSAAEAWAMSVTLPSGAGSWCVDSTGKSASSTAGGIKCS